MRNNNSYAIVPSTRFVKKNMGQLDEKGNGKIKEKTE